VSQLFVIRGENPKKLCIELQRVMALLEQHTIEAVAFMLHRKKEPEGSLVSIVAQDTNDLKVKLARAKSRLEDPECREILDVTGIYYNKEGLYKEGSLAFLFPGEGSQYINMLRDLREQFPIVKEIFSLTNETDILFLPETATAEEKESAERELRKFSTAMFSVLMADWALFKLLTQLGLRPDAMAGHSMGELAALGISGYLDVDVHFFDRVSKTMQMLDQQEVLGNVPEATLLAVGAGKNAIIDLIDESLTVAMDNCPHQSVVVGPKEPMARFELELQTRSIFYEKLPFTRPYHTKLFEPLLEHLDKMFDNVTFCQGAVKVYSCSTAKPFPTEPAQIRHLAVSHWATPVEFSQMIKNMHADGIRLFVEVGPRQNLSSFVTDILRGESFAAIASNVQRRSGLSQLHHLLGQLLAHGVPLTLDTLYPPVVAHSHGRQQVFSHYLDVMEQFLDLQQEFMQSYLASKQRKTPLARLSLTGEVVRHDPLKTLVLKRKMSLDEDIFATHHTVGGRLLSKVDPAQYGLPVIPGTFSLEIAAQASSLLVPEKVVTKIRDVRLMRWLAYDEDAPISIEIRATCKETDLVQVEIYDLGPDKAPFDAPKMALRAMVELSDTYPEAPLPKELSLTNARSCNVTLDIMHQNLFHGPIFRGVVSTDRFGDEGIESKISVLNREGILRSTKEPNFLLDPVLLDVSMHPLVTWHLEQPDQSGRILLPAEIQSLEFFGPAQPVGTELACRGWITDSSTRHFTHDVETLGPNGRLHTRLKGAKFWRFYVPFAKVNFHGPKDEYFLSKEWGLERYATNASLMKLDVPLDLKQAGMRLVTSKITLSPHEQQQFKGMQVTESRLDDWLFGRIAAKDAIRAVWKNQCGEKLFLADIEIDTDAHGKPVARLRDQTRREMLPTISIAHTDGVAVALSSFQPHVGIDIEKIKPREKSFEAVAFDAVEQKLLDQFGQNRHEGITRFWCAKEAVAKALGRGLVDGPQSLYVRQVDLATGRVLIALGAKLSLEFPTFSQQLLACNTRSENEYVVATTFCEGYAQ